MEEGPHETKAVILALWQSIEANNQFLASEAAMRINEQLQPLVNGLSTMTRWQLGVGAHLLDYIPYTNFRKFRLPASPAPNDARPLAHGSWLKNARGLNVLAACVDECSNNQGCHACNHSDCARESERLVMLSLNGLSPKSIGNRVVQSEKGAELLSSFTIEWTTSMGSERSSDWGSPVSRDDSPPQRLSRESSGSESRSYWNTILGDSTGG